MHEKDFAAVKVGDRIRLGGDRFWWLVRDRDERYIVATRQQTFAPKGDLLYTVIDLTGWQDHKYNGCGNGVVRSSLNSLGGGWDIAPDGTGAEGIIPSLRSGQSELSNRRVMDVWRLEHKPVEWREGQYIRVRHEGGNSVTMQAKFDGGVTDPAYYLRAGGWRVDYVGDDRPADRHSA